MLSRFVTGAARILHSMHPANRTSSPPSGAPDPWFRPGSKGYKQQEVKGTYKNNA